MAHPGKASPSMTRRQGGTKHPSHTSALSCARLRTRRFEHHDVLSSKSEASASRPAPTLRPPATMGLTWLGWLPWAK